MFVYQRVVPFSVTWLRKPGKNRIQVVNDTCGDGPEYARILPTMRYA
jgi:hypothetical protein